MTPEDRARLRRLAQDLARPLVVQVQLGDLQYVTDYWNSRRNVPAIDAIALWTLLYEATCLLCGKGRDEDGGVCGCSGGSTHLSGCGGSCGVLDCGPGPDVGSVLCSACRNYPKRGRR